MRIFDEFPFISRNQFIERQINRSSTKFCLEKYSIFIQKIEIFHQEKKIQRKKIFRSKLVNSNIKQKNRFIFELENL